jgi:hypothetical protein
MRFLRASFTMAALVMTATLAVGTAAHAQSAYDYPWCAVYGASDGSGATSCYFATREQCLQTLSGIGGVASAAPITATAPATSGGHGATAGATIERLE